MAPSRKKGANKAKLNGQLSLGDLVLAKVKGFPAWPAKISRPEDWKRTHDPRKYFVQFFGTEEIAFVAPADIQAFTSEAKIKLSARGQPKTKHFARAVKEICEAFEELQQKHLSDAKCTTDKSVIGSEGPSTDGLKDDVKKRISEVGRNGEAIIDEPGDHGTGLERCSSRQAETVNQGLEPTGICLADHSSHLHETSKKKLKASNGLHLPRESEKFTSSPVSSQMKEDFSSNKIERDVSVEQPNGSSQSNCLSDLSGGSGCEPMGSPLASGGSIHMKQAEIGGGQGGFANGHKSKMSSGSKGKHRSSKNTHKSGSSGLHSFKYIESSDPGDVSEFFEKLKTGLQSKYSAGECMEDSPSRALRVDLSSSGRKQWSMLEGKIDNEVASGLQKDVVGSPKKLMGRKPYIKKKVAELEGRQPNLAVNVISRPSKRSKCADLYVEGTNRSVTRNTRIDSSSYNIDSNKIGKYVDIKLKEDSQMASRPQKAMILSNSSDDDSILPLMKRHRKSSESIPGSAIPSSEDRMDKDHAMQKNDRPQSDESGFSASKLHSKRRAVCIYEEEEDEEQPKTPIHAGCARMVKKPSSLANSVLSSNVPNERTEIAEKNIKVFCELKDDPTKEAMLLDKPARELSTSILRSPVRLESEKLFLKDTKPVSVSLINSPCLASGAKTEQHKAINPPDEVSNVSSLKKASSDKVSGLSSNSLPQHQVMVQKSRLISTGGALKATPKAKFLVKDVAVTAGENSAGNVSFPVGRLRIGGDDQSRSVIDTKTADSSISMRHLIAAAQEKRRLAHLQNISHANPSLSMLTATDAQGVCSSPVPEVQPFSYATSNLTLPDLRRFNLRSAFASPSSHSYQSSSLHQVDELEERRVSSGHRAAGGSLSGGTEAAVARDAFEGMIETLSRTKESIGRATRLAIDCAKYGIANEVVELLIRKLESEPSFHRRVDLFFLVDSITQCSHSQKGIAGASYIPTVQAALPRLLGAAAPSGANARENRRQCLKVLRLWLERKILPELVLRRYMNDIGVPSDDVSSSCFLRRPSRVERAVDDPIREMEGMLVDEYGSNATFQLPGFFPSNAFEDEDDDQPSSTCKEADDGPYVDSQVCEQTESCMDTPNDRRHQILEDVDGELEMEDASEHRKDGRSMSTNPGASIETIKQSSDRNSGLFSDGYTEFPPLPEGSPPLPLESPPLPPPLPSSPPPSPPPLPPSSPSPPPPPPPLPLDPPPADAHPSGPMHSVHSQLLLPSQPSVLSQPILPSKPSLQSSPQQLTYQPHVPHDYCSTPGGNQLVQMAENASLGVHADGTIQKEIFSQMSPCFGKAGAQSSREIVSSRKLEYGKKDVYLNSQPSQTCQLFQSSNSPFVQRPSHTVSIQQPPGNFSYAQPPLQQQLSHPYPQTYSFPSLPDGRRQFSADEQWRMPSSEFTDSQHGGWMSGGRNPSCSGQPFVKEGYVRPSLDRLPTNMVFQPSTPNTARAPVPGRGVPQILSCRADVSGINCWRPV